MFGKKTLRKYITNILAVDLEQFSSLEKLDAFVRLRFCQLISSLLSSYAVFYFFRNLYLGEYFKLSVNVAILVYLGFLNVILTTKRDIDLVALLSVPMFLLLEFFFIYAIPARDVGVVWLFASLLFMIYIGSPKLGFFFSLLSLAILLGAALNDILGIPKTDYTRAAWTKIIFVHIIMQAFSYLFSKRHLLLIRFFEKQHYTDPLTKLPNRSRLEKDVEGNPHSCLFLIDIIGFSEINNFYGRHIGNALLRAYAKKLQELLDLEQFQVYRFFADIFAILSLQSMEKKEAQKVAGALLDSLEAAEFPCGEAKIHLQVLAGISSSEKNKLETADMALREAHATNHKTVFYSKKIDKSNFYKTNLKSLDFINEALSQNRVLAYFQPIYQTNSRRVHHAEALMRVLDKDGKPHTPFPFISVAKKANLYPQLSQIMLKNAAEFARTYRIPCSVNIADTDLHHIDFLIKNVEAFFPGDLHSLLGFELLEDNALKEGETSTALFSFAQKQGAKVAIDDFGAGYSNFRRLMDLHFDYLKIDGSLIQSLDSDEKSKAVVSTIVSYAQNCGLETVAEFVHSASVASAVQEMGITYSQGFHLGQPVPLEDFHKFL